MDLLNVLDISASAVSAQSVRLNTTASNIANAQSVTENPADTYRAKYPVFAAVLADQSDRTSAEGVNVLDIVESDAAMNLRYEPDHPYADEGGYVTYPNVSVVEEMANMMSASRSFQLNIEVMNTARSLAERVLNLGN